MVDPGGGEDVVFGQADALLVELLEDVRQLLLPPLEDNQRDGDVVNLRLFGDSLNNNIDLLGEAEHILLRKGGDFPAQLRRCIQTDLQEIPVLPAADIFRDHIAHSIPDFLLGVRRKAVENGPPGLAGQDNRHQVAVCDLLPLDIAEKVPGVVLHRRKALEAVDNQIPVLPLGHQKNADGQAALQGLDKSLLLFPVPNQAALELGDLHPAAQLPEFLDLNVILQHWSAPPLHPSKFAQSWRRAPDSPGAPAPGKSA